ncbi:MAG: helix-turn-helix domain-containing protein [Deltaproteobacteria bacterium]|nr:MAG: helix-turn-helix domain-containing protein [Deltaproteobacteria bacterium]
MPSSVAVNCRELQQLKQVQANARDRLHSRVSVPGHSASCDSATGSSVAVRGMLLSRMESGQVVTPDFAARFSTDRLDSREQFDAWREQVRMTFGPAAVSRGGPGAGAFHAVLETLVLGELAVSSIVCGPMTFERTRRDVVRREHDGFTAGLILAGCAAMEQDERNAYLHPGDLILCDDRRPLRIHFDQPFRQVVFHCDRAQLESRLPDVEERLAKCVEDQAALASMAEYIAAITRLPRSPATGPAVVRHAFESLAVAIGGFPARRSASRIRLARVHEYIERQLADPALSPAMIAAYHRISRRHLYRLFDEVGDSVAGFIRRRRLVRCKAMLGDALQADRSITEIALACGFNDATTFGRAFRAAFGVAPRDYRRLSSVRSRHAATPAAESPCEPMNADQGAQACQPRGNLSLDTPTAS